MMDGKMERGMHKELETSSAFSKIGIFPGIFGIWKGLIVWQAFKRIKEEGKKNKRNDFHKDTMG